MRSFLILSGMTALMFLSLNTCRGNKRAVSSVSSEVGVLRASEAVDLIQNSPEGTLTIVDVRTPEEVEEGKIEGATNINFYSADFEDKVLALDRGVRYLIYCHSGSRARKAAEFFHANGFSKVYRVIGGGYAELRAANAPTTR